MTESHDTYQRIIESARDLMYASSYAEVGVAAICEKAEVKKGSFYHFFKSKQELTLAVIDTYFNHFKDELLAKAFSADVSPLKQIEHLFHALIEMQIEVHHQTGQIFGCPFGNLATELATQDEPIRHKLEHVFTQIGALLQETLQQAVEQGELDAVDTAATGQAMLAYFEGILLLAKTKNDPALLHQLSPAILKIRIPTQA